MHQVHHGTRMNGCILYVHLSQRLTCSPFLCAHSGFALVMLTQVNDINEYAEQELIDHFLLNAMGQPKDPPLDKQDFIKVYSVLAADTILPHASYSSSHTYSTRYLSVQRRMVAISFTARMEEEAILEESYWTTKMNFNNHYYFCSFLFVS